MHPFLVCLQPFTNPPIPHTVIMPCQEDVLAPSILHGLCSVQTPSGLVLDPRGRYFLHYRLVPYGILFGIKVVLDGFFHQGLQSKSVLWLQFQNEGTDPPLPEATLKLQFSELVTWMLICMKFVENSCNAPHCKTNNC